MATKKRDTSSGMGITKPTDRNLPTWKSIKLGTSLKTADDFRRALKNCNMRLCGCTSNILKNPDFTVAAEEIELNLAVISVAELGFKNGATLKQIYSQAKKLDLRLCPAEVGPQLRLQYKNQPRDEWLIIAMNPIVSHDENLSLFGVGRTDSDLCLSCGNGNHNFAWDPNARFVFSLLR